MSQPKKGKRSKANNRSQVENDPPEECKKPKRRVSFSDKAQVREFKKYLNKTDSSSECNSSHGDVSNANVTITKSTDMSMDTSQFDTSQAFSTSYVPGFDSAKLGNMTQYLVDLLTSEEPSLPIDQASTSVGGEDCSTPKRQPILKSQSLVIQDDDLSSPLGESWASDNMQEKSFLDTLLQNRLKVEDSMLVAVIKSEDEDHVEESLPPPLPQSRASFSLGDLSKTNLAMTMMQETVEDSKVVDYDFEITSRSDMVRPSKLSMDLSSKELNDIHMIQMPDNFLEDSMDQLSNNIVANITTNVIDASLSKLSVTNPVELSVRRDNKILDTGSSVRPNYFSNFSTSSEHLDEALEQAYRSILDDPVPLEPLLCSDDMEDYLTAHRKNFNWAEMYEDRKRNPDEQLDMTLIEFDDDVMDNSATDESREDESKEEGVELTLQEWRDWLKDLKKKLGKDDNELVEESYICHRPESFSFVLQLWSAIFDFLISNSSNKKFCRYIDSMRTSKKNFEKSFKSLDDAIKKITQNLDIKPDSSKPVVMVTRKTKSDLDEKRKEFFEQRDKFSELINEYLEYNVRSIDESGLFVGIQGLWVINFFFDQSAARSGVMKIADVKSGLLMHCMNHIRESLGEHHRIKNDHILEYLLKDHLPKEPIKSEVTDLASLIKTLDRLASLHREASQISQFVNDLNPMSMEEICSLADDTMTFEFMEPSLSLRFSVSTNEFRLPSLCTSPPKWIITKHRGRLSEPELRFAINIVKLDAQYYENVYKSVSNCLRSLPQN